MNRWGHMLDRFLAQRMINTFTDLIRYTSAPNQRRGSEDNHFIAYFLADHMEAISNDNAARRYWFVIREWLS